MKPQRIQRKRTKGFKLPPNTVCVDRTTRFGNSFKVGPDGDARTCVAKFVKQMFPYRHRGDEGSLENFYVTMANIHDFAFSLRGKNLACWCPLECTECDGSGRRYDAVLKEIFPITPPIINKDCPQCGGSRRQPCHADILLEVANDTAYDDHPRDDPHTAKRGSVRARKARPRTPA